MEQKTILKYETVALDDDSSALVILDQTALPNDIQLLHLTTQKEIWNAIHTLQVRGAPAIGVAAGFGIYLAAKQLQVEHYAEFLSKFRQAKDYLDSARPTAVNLSWALHRMERVVTENAQRPVEEIVSLLHRECVAIKDEDVQMCRRIGEIGLTLIRDRDGILTHCNAGQLATSRYGTALAPIHVGRERGMNFHVFTDETRPLLQGARLSAFELMADGVDTTLICDNMASQVMKNGWVQAVFVGCDRVAANGDVCNKIGTSGVAVLAKYYGIPFYVCGPTSTIDMQTARGEDIPIEQRPEEEVTERWYKRRMAPEGVHVYNPAFDVTPNELVTAIVTECGIARPPYDKSLKKIEALKANLSYPQRV
jgi:methylthioribose-1-phosphate isomerase